MRREDTLSHSIKQDTYEALSRMNSVRALSSTLIFSVIYAIFILIANLSHSYDNLTVGMNVFLGIFIGIDVALLSAGYFLLKNHERDRLQIYYRSVYILNALAMLVLAGMDISVSNSIIVPVCAAIYLGLVPCLKHRERRIWLYGYAVAMIIAGVIAGAGIRTVIELFVLGIVMIIAGNTFQDKTIEVQRTNMKLKDKTIAAEKDALTGLSNRRGLDRKVSVLWPFCSRNSGNVGIIEIDIDFFKKYNDRFGHPAGDKCLKRIAEIINDSAKRGTDIVARTGGEEFMIFVHEMTEEEIIELALKIRAAVDAENIPHAYYGVARNVTVSMGVAIMVPRMDNSFEDLYEVADRALYEAKNSGRHCVAYNGKIYGRMRNGLAVVNK